MEIELRKDADVFAWLAEPKFQQAWNTLYEQCPWATGYQRIYYVECWYKLYEDRYRPLLVTAVASDGSLLGLLALALDDGSNAIVGAGADDTVYQGWLALPGTSDAFIRATVPLLGRSFKRHHLNLKYLPPGTPLDTLRVDARLVRCSFSEPEVRPYMRTDADRIAKSFNGKTNRNLFNRLKRLGEVTFLTVTDEATLDMALDEYISQYDFRQAAMYDFPPFRVDPAKKAFYRALMAQGLLHVSLLKVGETIVSVNIGLIGKDSVQIGIAHSPLYADYSPGRLHIYLLCMALAKEGYAYFDLTPGGGYKSKLATDNDAVYGLSALSSLRALQIRQHARVRKIAKAFLERVGVSTTAARLAVSNARRAAWSIVARGRRVPHANRYCIYQATLQSHRGDTAPLPLRSSKVDDLLHYDEADGPKSYQQFQYDAMKRLESRQDFYACIDDGRLVFCAWLGRGAAISYADGAGVGEADAGNEAMAVYDIYWHADVDGSVRLHGFLEHIMHDIHSRFSVGMVELVLPANDMAGRSEAEQAGFKPVQSF
jgi:CelD/BcsL family acetyltransferase involved in cellulose biosynthesis